MHLTDGPVPPVGPDEVRIHVEAAGVNRADLLQRAGKYAPPSTASPILGLEVAGYVAAAGERAGMVWNIGEEVCALVDGGGYATECVAPSVQCLPIPDGFSMVQAAALPEALFTVWYNVFQRCHLSAGETILVHGGTSGVGVIAIQMAKAIGAKVFATAGSAEKCGMCVTLGAEVAIDYHTADFASVAQERTNGRGVDVILDMVGGEYFDRNLQALAMEGRLVTIAHVQGSRVDVDLSPIMQKRLTITGSTMRRLPPQEKAVIAQELMLRVWPSLERGAIIPVIDSTYPMSRAADAHRAHGRAAHREDRTDELGYGSRCNGVARRSQLPFPSCHHSARQAVPDQVDHGTRHVHECVDAEYYCDRLQRQSEQGESAGEDDESRSRNSGHALAGEHQCEHHHELLTEGHVNASGLRRKHRRDCEVQRAAVEIERVAGRHDERDDTRRHPHLLHALHSEWQSGFGGRGGERDERRLANRPQEGSEGNPREHRNRKQDQYRERDEGAVQRQHELAKSEQHANAAVADRHGERCSDSDRRIRHHDLRELEHEIRQRGAEVYHPRPVLTLLPA